MERWCGRVALITGASAGIGAALTERLVKLGMNVVGCAREVQRIEAIGERLQDEKGKLLAVKCDVTIEEEIKSAFKKAKDEFGGVDVCVNNAGLSHPAPLLTGDAELWRNILDVNVLGVAICTREAFKSMKDRKIDDGHIINVNSMSGHRLTSGTSSNMYAASKFAVTAMTEGVRNELRQMNSNIRISQLSPGLVATEFHQRNRNLSDEAEAKRLQQSQHLEAEDMADAIIYQLSAPPHVQIHDILVRPTQQKF